MKYCIVILHFKVASITIESINNILNSCNDKDTKIIVVDNNSKNGSMEEIKEEFEYITNIDFIEIEKNVGFAKANNIGYTIAKHKYNSQFIIIINNDIFINDSNFLKEIQSIYDKYNFDILGPNIITKDGYHQNPNKDCIKSKSELNRLIVNTRIKLLLMPLYNLKKPKERPVNINSKSKELQFGEPLHGSCLIYSKKYIGKHEYAFCPDTFLYAEEDFLYYLAQQEKLNLVYSPSLTVFHNEDVATNAVHNTDLDKRKFQLSNSLQSLLILKKLMNTSS